MRSLHEIVTANDQAHADWEAQMAAQCPQASATPEVLTGAGIEQILGVGIQQPQRHRTARERAEGIAWSVLAELDLGDDIPPTVRNLTEAIQSGWLDSDAVFNLVTTAAERALLLAEKN